jgi:hypothetical protein
MDHQRSVFRRSTLYIFAFLLTINRLQGFAQTPTISAISPASGPAGSTVVISGTNFAATPAGNKVFFGAAQASVSSASAGSLSVVVPSGATYMPVTVSANGLTAYSPKPFLLTFAGGGTSATPSFDAPLNVQTDLHPYAVILADFDGDGRVDFATPNNYSTAGSPASISVVANTGSSGKPSFGTATNIPTGVFTDALAVGDINGDGKPDLASVSVQASSVSIFINSSSVGNISFTSGPGYTTGTSPSAIAIADIDGDGKPDLLVVNEKSSTLSVFRNISSGGTVAFASRQDYATGVLPIGLAVADLDGDGKPDVAVVNNLSNTVSIFHNTSTAGSVKFSPKTDVSTTSGTDNPYAIAIADIDGDGKPDLIVANYIFTQLNPAVYGFLILRNTAQVGQVSFSAPVNYDQLNSFGIGVGDMNGDGKPDVVVTNQGPGGGLPGANLKVWANSSVPGTINLGVPASLGTSSPFAVAIGDIDNDGVPDLLVSNSSSNTVSVFHNRILEPYISTVSNVIVAPGNTVTLYGGNFTGCTSVTFDSVPAASFTVVSDNQITVVVGSGATGNVVVMTPRGSGSFGPFTFTLPPVITSFSPATGGNGSTITINGKNFLNTTTSVSIGGVPPSSFTVVSPDMITAVVGAGASGDISVTTRYGTASLPGFRWVVLPVVTSLVPIYAGNGIPITVNGQYFTGATSVTFGGVPASSFTVVNDNTITAAPAAGASGDVVVTTTNGSGSFSPFLWLPAPVITSFSPTGMYNSTLTLTGTDFTQGNYGTFISVSVGGVDVTSYASVSPNAISITFNNFYNQPVSGDIVVTTWGGAATAHGFVYYNRPSATSIQPDIAGTGMPVTITGVDFTSVSAVTLGGVPVSSYTVVSPDTITAIVGEGASGPVTVTNPAGSNYIPPGFIYTESPLIFSYSPHSGPVGTVVTINGGNFSNVDVVNFGGVSATPLSVSLTQITVVVPLGAGYGPVSVTSPSTLQAAITDVPFDVTFPSDPNAFDSVSFAGHMEFGTGAEPTDLAMGDLDGDGKQDVATVNFADGTVSVFRNTSTGANISFAGRMDIVVGSYTKNIGIADIDGDGKPDIVVTEGNSDNCAGCGSSGVIILRNVSTPGHLAFAPPITIASYYKFDYMAIGDLNNDGKPDVAGGDAHSAADQALPYLVFINTSTNGHISFDQHQFGIPNPSYDGNAQGFVEGVAIRDVDGDGFADLILGTTGFGSTGFAAVIRDFGNNYANFIPDNHLIGSAYYSYYYYPNASYPVAANFYQSQYPDIVTTDWMFGNLGNLSFTGVSYYNGGGPGVACDLNGDGKPDMVRTGLTSDSVIWVFKDSTASPAPFAAAATYPALKSFKHVIAGDLDGDGKPEIVVSNQSYNSISVFRNRIGEAGLPAPVITSFTPGSGGYATAITITGSHFNQATNVNIGGTPVLSYTVVSDETITAVVDTGASGVVSITTPGGVDSLGTFGYLATAVPIITSISPMTAIGGTTEIITGANLGGVTGVNFGNAAGVQVDVISQTRILVVVDTSTSDTVTVKNAAGSGDIGGFVFVGTPGMVVDGSSPLCQGQELSLIAQTANVHPAYQWYSGSTPVATGDTLVVDSAGTYYVNTIVNGVSSPVSAGSTVSVTALPARPAISQQGDTLSSSALSGNEWYSDTTAAAVDTGQIFLPVATGTFWVRDVQNGCVSAFSAAFAYKPPKPVDTTSSGNRMSFAPNPATSYIVANFAIQGTDLINVEIFDINGRLLATYPQVSNGARLDVARLPTGLFFIKVYAPDGKALGTSKLFKF